VSLIDRRRLPRDKVLAHFRQAFRTDAANRLQIVDTFKRAVRFAHLQNLVRRRRTDARHLLQFRGRRCIDVYGLFRRLFPGDKTGWDYTKSDDKKRDTRE
jgi:hypothetical protein